MKIDVTMHDVQIMEVDTYMAAKILYEMDTKQKFMAKTREVKA